MKRNFSGTTAQQAPSPRIARQPLVSLPGTLQIAFQKPHCTRLTLAFASTRINNTEMIVEGFDGNRLARSHLITRLPAALRYRARSKGSGFSGASVTDVMDQRSTSAMRALYQFMKKLMPRLMVRNTAMMRAMASMAWPVWFSVVFAIDTMSW